MSFQYTQILTHIPVTSFERIPWWRRQIEDVEEYEEEIEEEKEPQEEEGETSLQTD